jgi:cyclopropane fatty-acyl-phospholipid synthase-like methyltransferase
MEKVALGFQMARHWTDPTILLIVMVPYAITVLALTVYYGYLTGLAATTPGFVLPTKLDDPFVINVALTIAPYLFTVFCWKVLYHSLFEEPGVDTSQFVVFREKALADYYRHRRIPMCDLVEFYISEQFDWNEECEGGDCYMILENHRHEFVNFKVTWSQIYWLLSQFTPSWLVSRGLGKGSSSGKSIEETTKEIDEHYNKGNDVFSCILGKAMVYTCGIFHQVPEFASSGHDGDYAASADDGTLETAQYNKMKMICDKLMLKEGETFLDIGCGWGTLARHAASEVGAIAHGVTLSREGKIYCDMASERTGIPTTIFHCDYREIPDGQKFDKIASIEMAEHVGVKNFVDPYLLSVKNMLANKDSMFMMQVAGLRQGSNWEDVAWGLFMSKFVFPGADASTPLNWYIRQCEMAGFEVHSVETIGRHYSHTLHKWYDNWMSHKDEIVNGEIDAISDHSTGSHLFRLNELTWAWCTIAAGNSATCYQILMHPNVNDFPRDQWVNKENVSGEELVGIGLNQPYMKKSKTTKKTPAKKTPAKKSTKKTPTKASAKKATPKKSSKKATPKSSTKKRVASRKKTK